MLRGIHGWQRYNGRCYTGPRRWWTLGRKQILRNCRRFLRWRRSSWGPPPTRPSHPGFHPAQPSDPPEEEGGVRDRVLPGHHWGWAGQGQAVQGWGCRHPVVRWEELPGPMWGHSNLLNLQRPPSSLGFRESLVWPSRQSASPTPVWRPPAHTWSLSSALFRQQLLRSVNSAAALHTDKIVLPPQNPCYNIMIFPHQSTITMAMFVFVIKLLYFQSRQAMKTDIPEAKKQIQEVVKVTKAKISEIESLF